MTGAEREFVMARSALNALRAERASRWEISRASRRAYQAEDRLREQGYDNDWIAYLDGVADGKQV